MANKDEIMKTILSVAGNPESGVVKQNVAAWAEAIVALDNPEPPTKTRDSLVAFRPPTVLSFFPVGGFFHTLCTLSSKLLVRK